MESREAFRSLFAIICVTFLQAFICLFATSLDFCAEFILILDFLDLAFSRANKKPVVVSACVVYTLLESLGTLVIAVFAFPLIDRRQRAVCSTQAEKHLGQQQ